jgi:DNA-binding PadR family transcriptional regulator
MTFIGDWFRRWVTKHDDDILAALAGGREVSGRTIATALNLNLGTVYARLAQMEAAGSVTSRWEQEDAPPPRRRLYRLRQS